MNTNRWDDMSKKKIVLITQSGSGGVRRHVTDLIDGLDLAKFEVVLIYNAQFADHALTDWIAMHQDTVKVYNVPTMTRAIHLKQDMRAFWTLYKILKTEKPDIVHAHSSKAGIVGRLAAAATGVTDVYYTPHGYAFMSSEFSTPKKIIFAGIEGVFSRLFTRMTLPVSQSEMDVAVKYHVDRPGKFHVVENGIQSIDKDYRGWARSELQAKDSDIVVGNVARLSHQKNPEQFIRVAAEVLKQNSNFKFIWVGDGPLKEEMATLLAGYDLGNRVVLLGNRDDAQYLMAGFDAYFVTSDFEGYSYALLEAARVGVPVFGKKVNGVVDFAAEYSLATLYAEDAENCEVAGIIQSKMANRTTDEPTFYNHGYAGMMQEINGIYLD